MGQGLHMPAWNALMLVPRHKQDFYWEYFRMHNRQIICMHDNFSTEKFQMNPYTFPNSLFYEYIFAVKSILGVAYVDTVEWIKNWLS